MSNPDSWIPLLEAQIAARQSDDGSHDIGHLRRVYHNARQIARIEGGDLEILVAAAYLHDLVEVPKSSPDRARASHLSAEAAAPILSDLGFPTAKTAAVMHAVAAHSFSAGITPQTLEARILQDADRLEAIGAIGIARCFYVAGRMGSSLVAPEDPKGARRPFDDRRYALDHFPAKLFQFPKQLCTATGRQMARERLERMRQFYDDFLAETALPDA